MLIDGGKNKNSFTKSNGFTIVELMIALTVLSTILLLSTIVLINIGALYSKGVNAASLQNTTRTIAADLTSALQFSGNNPSGCSNYPAVNNITCATDSLSVGGTDIYSFCINTTRYSYVLNREMGADTGTTPPNLITNHVLWRDTMKNNLSCPPLNITTATVQSDGMSAEGNGVTSTGYDMVPDHMRLTRFKVKDNSVTPGVYQIETWLAFGDSDLLNTPDAQGATTCKGGTGNQFCGTSALSTSVKRRLQ